MKSLVLSLLFVSGCVSAQVTHKGVDLYSLPIKTCETNKERMKRVGDERYPIYYYRCIAELGEEQVRFYPVHDSRHTPPKEVVEICTKKTCTTKLGTMPFDRIENLIDSKVIDDKYMVAEARAAYLYDDGQKYILETGVVSRYLDAINKCKGSPESKTTKTFTWVGRIRSDGKFTFGQVKPKNAFSQCVNVRVISLPFPIPPTAKYDYQGGYPLTFNFPYGDFDGGPTQGLERKPEEIVFASPEDCGKLKDCNN